MNWIAASPFFKQWGLFAIWKLICSRDLRAEKVSDARQMGCYGRLPAMLICTHRVGGEDCLGKERCYSMYYQYWDVPECPSCADWVGGEDCLRKKRCYSLYYQYWDKHAYPSCWLDPIIFMVFKQVYPCFKLWSQIFRLRFHNGNLAWDT